MSKLKIITDSASDITYAEEAAYGIRVIPFPIALDGKSYLSRVDFDNQGFYTLMNQHPDALPTTSQITPFQFQEMMEEEVAKGADELMFLLINSKGSATYSNAVMAKDAYFEEHPEQQGKVKIAVIDSRGYSLLYGYLAVEAAKRAMDGETLETLEPYVRAALEKRMIYFGIYSLKYAGKSGRIPSAAAFWGDKLGLKPVMKIFDHEITTAAKARGEQRLISMVADLVVRDIVPGTPYQLIYGAVVEDMEKLRLALTERLGYGPTGAYQIGAAIAANAGPRAVGVSFDIP